MNSNDPGWLEHIGQGENTMFPVCLITGCDLFIADERKTLHGDLHWIGTTYIFNGCLADGQAAWSYKYNNPEHTTARVMIIKDSNKYFERRGVLVVDINDVEFNSIARGFLNKRLP